MTSTGRVEARDQLPKRDAKYTGPGHLETEAGTGEGIRCTAPEESAVIKLLVP